MRQIQQMLKKYVRASLHRSDISVHKLRSSFDMEFYKAEHDILVLQNRMGHASIAATNIYARASDKEEAVKEWLLNFLNYSSGLQLDIKNCIIRLNLGLNKCNHIHFKSLKNVIYTSN